MAGSTAQGNSQSTTAALVITRREMDLIWDSHMREHATHTEAHEREHKMVADAIIKAENSMDKRLEGMNEFRNQLKEQAGTFINRDTFDVLNREKSKDHDKIEDRLLAIEKWRSGQEGRIIGISASIGFIVVVINIAIRFIPT